MRLYTVIGNDLYLKQVVLNDAINASISPRDFKHDTFNSEMSSYLDRFLYYTNRESWDCDAIVAYTTKPSYKASYLANNEVLISFEIDEKDVLLADYGRYLEYTYQVDKVENNMVKSEIIANRLKKYFSNVEQHVLEIDNFFDAIGFVKEIPCSCIKLAYVNKNNPIVQLLQKNKNKMFRRIPMLYLGKGNGKVKELLKHKPQNISDSSKKLLKSVERQDNVFWCCKRKVW